MVKGWKYYDETLKLVRIDVLDGPVICIGQEISKPGLAVRTLAHCY